MRRLTWGLVAIVGMLAFALVAAGPASAKDRNNDRIPDRWEKRYNLSLKVNQARRDQDRDGLNNRGEYRSDSNPREADTDGDGTEDGDENAGTVASFDGTTLVINLLNGDTISGTVTEDTVIKCGSECNRDGEEEPTEETVERHEGNSGPGSESSGPGPRGPGGPPPSEEGDCSAEDLVEGVAIHEAELKLEDGEAVFTEIELARVEETEEETPAP